MEKRKHTRLFALGLVGLAVLLLLVNLCFFGACDELYFTAWDFSSLKNLILSRPEPKGPYVVGVMHNGRIMGNLLGVAQAKLLFSSVGWLRGVLFTGVLLVFAWLIMRTGGKRNGTRFLCAMALLIFAPKAIWADVYSWGVSFINYLIPLTCFLLCFCLLHSARRLRAVGTVFLFLLAFQAQLYAESVTVSFCAFALLLLFDRSLQKGPRLATAAGFLLGALAMFLNPEYKAVEDATRAILFDLPVLYERATELFRTLLLHDWVLLVLFSAVLASCLLGKSKGRTLAAVGNLLLGIALVVVWSLESGGTACPQVLLLILGVISLVLHSLSLLLLPDPKKRRAIFSLYAVAAISLLALIPVNHVYTPRLLAEGYFLIGAVVLCLLPDKLPKEGLFRFGLALLCVLWLGNLLYIYSRNCQVNRERVAFGRTQVEQGAETVTLPLVPYPDYVVNETRKKGDLGFLIYREVPLDQKLVFLSYGDWLEQSK